MSSVNTIVTITLTEGRAIKDGSTWRFEYFHKDHLGNTRVVYGNQKQVDEYKATMESPTPIATKEQAQFYNITTTRVTGYNRTPISIDVVAPDKSAETNGFKNGKAIGPAKMLQVSAGDRVQLEVYARYATGTGSNNTLITNLASAVTTTFQVVSGEAAFTALTNNVPVQAATIVKPSSVPKAYLFYILFNSSYVYQQFGYAQISSAALTAHQQLYLDITIPTGGFLYTYVADESKVNNASSVYFDDFNIIHTRNNNTLQVVQTTDYYPFGLVMAAQSYQKQSTPDNDYLYNGKELQDEHNLGWMDYGARMYMSDIGRWGRIDPLADSSYNITPFHFLSDDPINRIDPDGKDDFEINNRGRIVNRIKNNNADNIFIVGNDGNRLQGQSINFEYGTISAVRNPSVTTLNRNGESEEKTLTMFEVSGDENATKLFEFFANPSNTEVEWTHASVGTETSGKNIVGTSNEESSTAVGAYLRQTEYTLKEVYHNHPGKTAAVSSGDREGAALYNQKNKNTILGIYIYPNNYFRYNSSGIQGTLIK